MLFADAGRHGGAEQHGVHLVARALRSALSRMSSVIGSSVDLPEGRGVGFDDAGFLHGCCFQRAIGRMRMLPDWCTSPTWSGRISVVESISVTMAGPVIMLPASSLARA